MKPIVDLFHQAAEDLKSTMPTECRDESYRKVDLPKRQQQVLTMLKTKGAMTSKQLASYLGWEINQVTGRVHELMEAGIVEPEAKVLDGNTNRHVTKWRAKE